MQSKSKKRTKRDAKASPVEEDNTDRIIQFLNADRIIQFQIRSGFGGAPVLKPHNEQAIRLANIAHEEFLSPHTLEMATFMGFKVEYLDVMSEIKP